MAASEYLVHTISVQCLLLDHTTLDCVVRSTAMRRTPPNASEHRRNSTGCLEMTYLPPDGGKMYLFSVLLSLLLNKKMSLSTRMALEMDISARRRRRRSSRRATYRQVMMYICGYASYLVSHFFGIIIHLQLFVTPWKRRLKLIFPFLLNTHTHTHK